jgi:hypothetical protein
MSKPIEKRIGELERQSGVGRQYVFRIIFSPGLATEGEVYREIRYLMSNDGTPKGRFIRDLTPGEIVPGIDNPPWLKEEVETHEQG